MSYVIEKSKFIIFNLELKTIYSMSHPLSPTDYVKLHLTKQNKQKIKPSPLEVTIHIYAVGLYFYLLVSEPLDWKPWVLVLDQLILNIF